MRRGFFENLNRALKKLTFTIKAKTKSNLIKCNDNIDLFQYYLILYFHEKYHMYPKDNRYLKISKPTFDNII